MAIYTVHVPSGIAEPGRRAERTVVLRDGFSWGAFWFGALALAYRRLWLAALAWLAVIALVVLATVWLHLPVSVAALLILIVAFFTGLEARAMRQRALERRGFMLAAVLASASLDEAEAAFFRAEAARPAMPRHLSQPAPARASLPDVIGSLPGPGRA